MLKKSIFCIIFFIFSMSCYGQEIKLLFVGDAMVHGQLQQDMSKTNDGFLSLMTAIKNPILKADLAHVNVETAVGVPKTDSAKDKAAAIARWAPDTPYSGFPYFNVHPHYLDALKEAGFDVMQLSNNHSLDRKARGVDITQDQIKAKNLIGYGTRSKDNSSFPSVRIKLDKGGKSFYVAYVSCSFSTNGNPDYEKRVPLCFDGETDAVIEEITRQKQTLKTDIVVFTPHWGDEYSRHANKQQIELAKKAANAGADLIVGTHPHVLQEYTVIVNSDKKSIPVFYSLGNFFNWSINKEGTTSSVIAQVDFEFVANKFVLKKVSARPIAANNKRNSALHQRALVFVSDAEDTWKKERESIQKSIPSEVLLYEK